MEGQKAYYAVIPANVRYDKDLPANAKLLYGEITALSNEKGCCWATNQYFAELYGVSIQSVSHWIKTLKDKKYIKIEIVYRNGTKEIDKRIIKITDVRYTRKLEGGIKENFKGGIKENFKENITSINNKKKIYKRKVLPNWINEEITNEEITDEDIKQLDDLKDFLKKV